jgi:hypothetical protein
MKSWAAPFLPGTLSAAIGGFVDPLPTFQDHETHAESRRSFRLQRFQKENLGSADHPAAIIHADPQYACMRISADKCTSARHLGAG